MTEPSEQADARSRTEPFPLPSSSEARTRHTHSLPSAPDRASQLGTKYKLRVHEPNTGPGPNIQEGKDTALYVVLEPGGARFCLPSPQMVLNKVRGDNKEKSVTQKVSRSCASERG